jgi:hypothetical protein
MRPVDTDWNCWVVVIIHFIVLLISHISALSNANCNHILIILMNRACMSMRLSYLHEAVWSARREGYAVGNDSDLCS